MAESTLPVVIVGSGHAGLTAAKELRKLLPDVPICMVSADNGHYYYKPDLSKALAAGKSPSQLVKQDAATLASSLNLTLYTHVQVVAIDRAQAQVFLSDGRTLAYRALVLTLGADPIRLPIAGATAENLLSVNDLADYSEFIARLRPGSRVAILGAGLIGCEFANDLAAHGLAVSLVDMAHWPLSRLMPEPLGRALESALTELGVTCFWGSSAVSLTAADAGFQLQLADGRTLVADVVLSAVGLRARTQLAAAAGLACGAGILVNASMQTSAPNIYALGDCAAYGNASSSQTMPYILPIAHGSRALAAAIAERPLAVQFPVMPVLVKTPVLPTVICPPPLGTQGQWQITGEGRDWVARFLDAEGTQRGFALTGSATSQRGALAAQTPAPTLFLST